MRIRSCAGSSLQSSCGRLFYKPFLFSVILFACPLLFAQQAAPGANGSAANNQKHPEIASRDVTTTFKANVNLVTVHAVVRDAQGRAVGNLTSEDFHLFDDGKPQPISRFSVETAKPAPVSDAADRSKSTPPGRAESVEGFVPPGRYIAFVLDDVHGEFADLVRVKQAAERTFATSLLPTDRVAIFTTSGVGALDFTDDQARVRKALTQVQPRSSARVTGDRCPYMTYYMADLIINWNDQRALSAAIMDAMECLNTKETRILTQYVEAAARRELETGNLETRLALGVVRDVVRRMTARVNLALEIPSEAIKLTKDKGKAHASINVSGYGH